MAIIPKLNDAIVPIITTVFMVSAIEVVASGAVVWGIVLAALTTAAALLWAKIRYK